jgi:HlyD family secretion protein
MLRLLLFLLVVGVVGLLGHGYYNQLFPKEKEYFTEKVVKMDVVEQVAVSGAAEPLERRIVQADIPQGAVVEEVFVDYNSPVKKGQVLARLADDEQRVRYEQAKIAVDAAEAMKKAAEAGLQTAKSALTIAQAKEEDSRRTKANVNQLDEGVVSSDSRSRADLGVKGAVAGVAVAQGEIKRTIALSAQADQNIENAKRLLRLAEMQIEKTTLKSPIDGYVFNMDVHVGDIIGLPKFVMMEGSGAPFEIASPPEEMQAVVKLSEADYSRVRVGQKVTFTVEAYPEEKFTGEVTQIRNAPTNDRTATTYPTVIRFKNRKDKNGEWMIRPRATVSADIRIREEKNKLVVPNAALLFAPSTKQTEEIPALGEGEGIVWLSHGHGRMSPRKIKKGITNGSYTQILSGELKEGDPLITAEPAKNGGGFQGLPLGG